MAKLTYIMGNDGAGKTKLLLSMGRIGYLVKSEELTTYTPSTEDALDWTFFGDTVANKQSRTFLVLANLLRLCFDRPKTSQTKNYESSYSHILLQNPEAGVSPRGQVALGNLLVKAVSQLDVNATVETYSELLLNTAQIAIAMGKLSRDDFTVLWLEKPDTKIHSIEFDERGFMINCPEGMFREFYSVIEEHFEAAYGYI